MEGRKKVSVFERAAVMRRKPKRKQNVLSLLLLYSYLGSLLAVEPGLFGAGLEVGKSGAEVGGGGLSVVAGGHFSLFCCC